MMIQPELLSRILRLVETQRRELPLPGERVQELHPVGPVRALAPEIESPRSDAPARAPAGGRPDGAQQAAAPRAGEAIAPGSNAARDASARVPGSPPGPQDIARLSVAGRLLAELAAARTDDAAPAGRPLLPDAPIDAARGAAVLRDAIAASGLFYESHQAEWVSNQRDTASLLREPQGRLSPLPAALTTASAEAANNELPGPPIHPNAAPIVGQQLNALEARQVLWSGEVWPGQLMRWEIGEDAGGRPGSPEEPDLRVWSTRVELELPRLGRIAARITLRAGALTVRLAADSPDTDTLVAARASELGTALAAAGLPVADVARSTYGEL